MCFTATTYTCGNLSLNILKLFWPIKKNKKKNKKKKKIVTKEEFM